MEKTQNTSGRKVPYKEVCPGSHCRVYSSENGLYDFREWYNLLYRILHAFSMRKEDEGNISINVHREEVYLSIDRQVCLNDDAAQVKALSESFSVIQERKRTEVKFTPDRTLWPDLCFDEKNLEVMFKDYAYLHPNQVIFWDGHDIFQYSEGLRDLLVEEFRIKRGILWEHRPEIEVALARTNSGESTIIDYVNTRRTDGGVHVRTLQKAIAEYFPKMAQSGYVAAMDISADKKDIKMMSDHPDTVGTLPEDRLNEIVTTIASIAS